ncbi:MAG TPA: phosphotransferase [Acidimicrobiia bacterium]|nr:phosphotransferase [Acidimicrobiia bacterium]
MSDIELKLLASGRDGDIFEFAPGLVLRRTRDGRSIVHEARTMTYAAEQGYPVPHIEEVRAGGTEIVMERIDGPLMVDAMVRPPWKLFEHLRLLADLHDRLHQIPGPDWLPPMPGGGDRLLHLDLHPLNVIMSPRGPVVIDWPNARRGEAMADVAVTYALVTCGRIPLPRPVAAALGTVRTPLVRRAFATRYLGPEFYRSVEVMAALKCFDENMAPDEIRALQRLARWAAAKAPG